MVHLYCLSDQFVQDGELMHNVSLCGCAAYHPVGCKRALMILYNAQPASAYYT